MSTSFARTPEGVVEVFVHGPLTPRRLRSAVASLDPGTSDPSPHPLLVLWNLAGATLEWSGDALRAECDRLGALRLGETCRVAVFAPDDLAFGLARMAGVHLEATGPALRAFRRRDRALSWLVAPARRGRPHPGDPSPADPGEKRGSPPI